MYQYNICSPIWHTTPAGFDLRLMRYMFLVVLISLFFMYLVIMVILKRSIRNLKADDSGSRLEQQQNFFKGWEREYMLMLGDHAVAVGFVMCFSPYVFEMMLSFAYLLLRVVYEVRKQKYQKSTKQIKTILRIINMALMICSMVGLSRTEWDEKRNQCRDSEYRFS